MTRRLSAYILGAVLGCGGAPDPAPNPPDASVEAADRDGPETLTWPPPDARGEPPTWPCCDPPVGNTPPSHPQ